MYQVVYKPGLGGNWMMILLSIHRGFTPIDYGNTKQGGFSLVKKTNWNFSKEITRDEIDAWFDFEYDSADEDLYYKSKLSFLKKHYFRNTQHRLTETELAKVDLGKPDADHCVLYDENKTVFRFGVAHGPGFFNRHREKLLYSIKQEHAGTMSFVLLDTSDYDSLFNRVKKLTDIGKFEPPIIDSYRDVDFLKESLSNTEKLLQEADVPHVKIDINALMNDSIEEYKRLCRFINEEPEIDTFLHLTEMQRVVM